VAPIFSLVQQSYNGPISSTTTFYTKIFKRLNILINRHSQAAEYYARWNRYMSVPSIAITCLSSIAAFMTTAENISQDTQYAFGISVGIMASISTMLQSISSGYKFSAKESGHRQTADEYNKLNIKLRFEMENPDPNSTVFIDNLEKQILDIQNISSGYIPQFIIDKVDEKYSDMEIARRAMPDNNNGHDMEIARCAMPDNNNGHDMEIARCAMPDNSNDYDHDHDYDMEIARCAIPDNSNDYDYDYDMEIARCAIPDNTNDYDRNRYHNYRAQRIYPYNVEYISESELQSTTEV